MNNYPEHERLKELEGKSQIVAEFIKWLHSSKYKLCTHNPDLSYNDNQMFVPAQVTIKQLLEDYFDIDSELIEKEKEQMLEDMRVMNNG